MNKISGMWAAAWLLASTSTAALAGESAGFFLNGNLGQSQYQNSFFSDRNDTAAALRAGYSWRNEAFDVGLEAGYVTLGKASANVRVAEGVEQHVSLKTTGPLLGANFRYKFENRMFLAARAGWFRSKMKFDPGFNFDGYDHASGNGTYSGATFGYDLSPGFSLGVSADHYEARGRIGGSHATEGVNMYSAFAEYRF